MQDALPPWGGGQTLPHAPQLFSSVFLSVQVSPPHTSVGGAQAIVHWALAPASPPSLGLLQNGVSVLHLFPQAPQLVVLVVSVSQPFWATLSQSARPWVHAPTLHVLASHRNVATNAASAQGSHALGVQPYAGSALLTQIPPHTFSKNLSHSMAASGFASGPASALLVDPDVVLAVSLTQPKAKAATAIAINDF
jgi:hypothetical protein